MRVPRLFWPRARRSSAVSIEDLDILRSGAAAADGVIHTAFNHDFSKFAENSEADRVAIETLGSVLEGTDRPILVTGGLALQVQGRLATEQDMAIPVSASYPRASEAAAIALAERGVRASVVRLPQVHDRRKFGLITYLIALAREKGVSAYVGDGHSRYAAVHVLDAASLYRLALEKGAHNARYHAVAEEGVLIKEIAEVIGRGLKVPVVAKSPDQATRTLRLARALRCSRPDRLKHAYSAGARMASNRPRADLRPRTGTRLRSVVPFSALSEPRYKIIAGVRDELKTDSPPESPHR